MIKMKEVDSSNIKEVGYDEDNKELHIRFHNSLDSVYVYSNVDKSIFTHLLNADSVGRAFNVMVKNNYTFRKE